MTCPKCGSNNVSVNTSTYSKSQSRSLIWNLLMIFLTAGIWIVWMLIRSKKERIIKETTATCQNCGHSWKPTPASLKAAASSSAVKTQTDIKEKISMDRSKALDDLSKLKKLFDEGVIDENVYNT